MEDVGALVIGLRLWRFVKIVEELSLGAAERLEEVEVKMADLERENAALRRRVEVFRNWRMYSGSSSS